MFGSSSRVPAGTKTCRIAISWQGPHWVQKQGKALGSRQFVGFYPGAVTRPGDISITDEEVAVPSESRSHSQARAVVVNGHGSPGNHELECATGRTFSFAGHVQILYQKGGKVQHSKS